MDDEKINLAINVLAEKIAQITNEFALNKNEKLNDKYDEKIKVLNQLKNEIYKGNEEYAEKVLEKNKKGIL